MTFRSICIAVYVFFYLIFTTPERIRLKKLEQTDPQEASRIAQAHVQKVFRHLLKISGVTIEVNGLENIPDEAALFVGNHSSYFDIIVTGAAIPGGVPGEPPAPAAKQAAPAPAVDDPFAAILDDAPAEHPEGKPIPEAGGTVKKKSMAASLYDLDGEKGGE